MLTIEQMQSEIDVLNHELVEHRELCINEEREPTEDEFRVSEEKMDRIENLERLIQQEQRREKINKRLQQPADPEKARAMKPEPEMPKFTGGEPRNDVNRIFATPGEHMLAIARACMGQRVDPRLQEIQKRVATGLGEGAGADGAFLLTPQYQATLLETAWQTGLLASRCNQVTIGPNRSSLVINGVDETSRADGSRGGGTRYYWVGEAEEKTKSKPKFRRIELHPNKIVVLVYVTDELLEDATALETFLTRQAGAEIGFGIDDAIMNGSGAGQPLGIMNSGCMVSVSAETGQAASTVLAENVWKMWARLLPQSQQSAVWLINQTVWPELFNMYLAVGTGGSGLFVPQGGISSSPYSSLLGRPIIPIEQCQALGTSGDIVLADFGGYILATKGAIQSDMSIHVRFVYDETCFRYVFRLDGQPELASAITPYKGGSSNTQSHFVKLAAR